MHDGGFMKSKFVRTSSTNFLQSNLAGMTLNNGLADSMKVSSSSASVIFCMDFKISSCSRSRQVLRKLMALCTISFLIVEPGSEVPQNFNHPRSVFFRCEMRLEKTFNFGFRIILP